MRHVMNLRGRELDLKVIELLVAAQIHRLSEERASAGLAAAADYASDPALDLWGLVADQRLVAIAGVEVSAHDRLLLHDFAVAVDRRRQGHGRRLIDFLRERFPGHGIEGHTLAEAAGFYAACGFDVSPDGTMPDGAVRYHFSCMPGP